MRSDRDAPPWSDATAGLTTGRGGQAVVRGTITTRDGPLRSTQDLQARHIINGGVNGGPNTTVRIESMEFDPEASGRDDSAWLVFVSIMAKLVAESEPDPPDQANSDNQTPYPDGVSRTPSPGPNTLGPLRSGGRRREIQNSDQVGVRGSAGRGISRFGPEEYHAQLVSSGGHLPHATQAPTSRGGLTQANTSARRTGDRDVSTRNEGEQSAFMTEMIGGGRAEAGFWEAEDLQNVEPVIEVSGNKTSARGGVQVNRGGGSHFQGFIGDRPINFSTPGYYEWPQAPSREPPSR